MRERPRALFTGAVAVALAVSTLGSAHAYMRHKGPVPAVGGQAQFSDSDINVIENLGQRIPSGLTFVDGHGKSGSVDALLNRGKPVLVTMGYYRCPQLCNLVHEGLAKGIREAGLKPGRDFYGVGVSVDPNEEPKSAATNEGRLLRSIQHDNAADWPFLFPAGGSDVNAKRLAEAVGFRYKFDSQSRQFAHAAVAFVLAPDGKISRYLYGVDFPARDLRLALVEASNGRVGTTLDRVLLTCFKYDPMSQRYTPYVFGFVRIGAFVCFLALLSLLAVLWRRELVMRRRRAA